MAKTTRTVAEAWRSAESLPSWRVERRCRGSIPWPPLCVGCKELAVLFVCELLPGAGGGRSSVQGAAWSERRAARARGGSRDRRYGRAGGRTRQARGGEKARLARLVRNARSQCARRVRDAARKTRSSADAGAQQARRREEIRARETALAASSSVDQRVFRRRKFEAALGAAQRWTREQLCLRSSKAGGIVRSLRMD